jgi:hypothetical protein
LAFAVSILACALPLNADTLPAGQAIALDGLFDSSLLLPALESANEFPSISPDLALPSGGYRNEYAFGVIPSPAESLGFLGDPQDNRSENGAEGVRRFILLTILFGAALRFLTSPAFYAWAADVFDPLDGY